MKRPRLTKPMEWALFYLKFRPRSVAETRRYLHQKSVTQSWTEEEVENTITRLIELSLLNDEEFARRFIDSQVNRIKKGKRWFQQKLSMAGISSDITESMLGEVAKTDMDRALELLKKKFGEEGNLDKADVAKAQRLLLSRGFSWSNVSSALASWRKKE